jgi:hypothetical protein
MKPRRPWWATYPRKYWTAEERQQAYRDGYRPPSFKWPARYETNLPGHYEPPVESFEEARRRRVDAIVKSVRRSRRDADAVLAKHGTPRPTRRAGLSTAEPQRQAPRTVTRNVGSVLRVR